MPPFHGLSTIAFISIAVLLAAAATPSQAALVTFSASGNNASDIQTTVDNFRTSLGTLNANVPVVLALRNSDWGRWSSRRA